MKKRMDRLKFIAKLNWRILFKEPFEKIFANQKYFEEFLELIKTKEGKIWLDKEFGKKYNNWQNT